MKLDPDIVRDLLIEIEAKGTSPEDVIEGLSHPKLSRSELSYYIWQLKDGGYVKATNEFTLLSDELVCWDACCLTFKGHEFADSAKDSLAWQATKEAAKSSGTASLDLIGKLLMAIAKKQLKERAGIDLDL